MKRLSILLAGMCALSTAHLGAAEPTTPPVEGGTAPAPALTPDQAEFWNQYQSDQGIQVEAVWAESEQWYLKARALLQAAHFVEAREAVEQAIRIHPSHEAAQNLRQDILAILSYRDDRLQMAANWLAAIRDVAVQEQAVRMAGLLASGDRNMSAGAYKEAFLDYDRVAIALRAFPYQFNWGDLPDEVEAKKLESQARARDAALAEDRALRQRADEEARIRSDMEEEALRAKVDEILRRAKEQFDRDHFRRASIDAWNAYQLDRRREDARNLYLESRRRAHVQFDAHYREERKERLARVNEDIHRDLIPQTELLVFPEDWFRRSLRTAQKVTEEDGDQGWRADLENKMEQEVSFVFEESALEEVRDFLVRNTGVNIVIAQDVYADPSIPPITLSGTMRLKTVLNWIRELTNLQMAIRNQAIYFSTEEARGDVVVRIYNITDLITPVVDFPGPELAFAGGAGDQGGFDIFGGDGGFDDAGGTLEPDDVIDFVSTSVSPESWDAPGAAITFRAGGQLFISQTPEIHNMVDELLTNLRNQASLQVNIQIRVLDVRRSFMEEIGIEWNDFAPVDVLRNPFTRQGTLGTNEEWAYALNSNNQLPANSAQNAFGNGFGEGLRTNYIFNQGDNILNLRQVNMVLEAVERESDQTIVNAPELTCFNGQRAHAVFMRQLAYISDYEVAAGGNLDPVIEVLNFGDIIDIRPYVSADRKYVTLEVRPSSVLLQDVFTETITAQRVFGRGPGSGGVVFTNTFPLELPNIEVRTLRTTVMLPDKGSLMLGGFVRGLRQRTHSGIPFLSHIPFLGRLFSKNGIYDETRHLMFMVSAEIVDLGERASLQ